MGRLRKYYREITIACAFFLLFVNVGFTSTAFSVYQNYLVDLPGIGNVGGSLIVTVRTLVALLCMFFTGLVFRKISPRYVFAIATLCSCAAFLCYGSSHTLGGLCFAALLAGIGYGFGGMVASTYLIGNWFSGKIGHISGFVAMGSGVAAIVVPLCAGWIIEHVSLSAAFYTEAATAFVVSAFLFLLVRIKPQDMGFQQTRDPKNLLQRLHGKSSDPSKDEPRKMVPGVDLPIFGNIVMVVAIVLLGGVSVVGYNYFGILLTTQGIDPAIAAVLISIAGIFLTLSKFLVGAACDKFGTLAGSCIFFVLLIVGLGLCALIGKGGVSEAAFAAIMLGIGMPLGTTGISLWSLELTTPARMLVTIKRFQLSYAFGGFAFNMMPGVLCQITGTYSSSYAVLTWMSIACAIMVIFVYLRYARQRSTKKKEVLS